ncbi:MAG: cytochrome c biogenesis protein CcdA [Clostridia bacterium]|nr:cytochrome c biogenesis protein CcdA [Clostridia bacterium]
MEYITALFVGVVSFLSPCMLPMLPIYLSYFSKGKQGKIGTLFRSLCFVAGFGTVFCGLGLFVGSLGTLLSDFHEGIELVGGIIIVLLGFSTLGLFHFPHANEEHHVPRVTGYVSAFLFGVVFSVSHLPCMGSFLGTALATAGVLGSAGKSVLLLLIYSLGMGIPFLIAAFLSESLGTVIQKLQKSYGVIRIICGVLLIALGIAMATGWFHHWLHTV